MSGSLLDVQELLFLSDPTGELVAFQETGSSWTNVLAFSSEDKAEAFRRASGLSNCQIVALQLVDAESLRNLVRELKRKMVRSLFVDLDFHTGECLDVWLVGEGLGEARKRQLVQEVSARRR